MRRSAAEGVALGAQQRVTAALLEKGVGCDSSGSVARLHSSGCIARLLARPNADDPRSDHACLLGCTLACLRSLKDHVVQQSL